MSIDLTIELRVDEYEVVNAIREYLDRLERTTLDEFLNERGLQNEGTDEDSEHGGRREGGVGRRSTGFSRHGCIQICGITADWIPSCEPIAWWPLNDAQRVRPERGEDCDDSADEGRLVRGHNHNFVYYDEAAEITFCNAPVVYDNESPGRWVNIATDRLSIEGAFNPNWREMVMGLYHTPFTEDAYQRSEALLLEHLTEEQTNQWKDNGCFMVSLPSGNEYTMWKSDTRRHDGRIFCLETTRGHPVPPADAVLARKLLLEADEEWFLENANDITVEDF